jgi:hypothetical protein
VCSHPTMNLNRTVSGLASSRLGLAEDKGIVDYPSK